MVDDTGVLQLFVDNVRNVGRNPNVCAYAIAVSYQRQ